MLQMEHASRDLARRYLLLQFRNGVRKSSISKWGVHCAHNVGRKVCEDSQCCLLMHHA